MKKHSKYFWLIIYFTALSNLIKAQSDIEWQKSFGGSAVDQAKSVRQTNDGGFIVVGSTNSNDGDIIGNHGGYDFWVLKVNASGNIIWQKTFGGSGNEFANSVIQLSDESYIVAGSSNSNDGDVSGNNGGQDIWVIKLSISGQIVWQISIGTNGDEGAQSIVQTVDEGFLIAGTISDGSPQNYYVVKVNDTGSVLWSHFYGGANLDDANSIYETSDSGFVVVGSSRSTTLTWHHGSDLYYDVYVLKWYNGSVEWGKSYGGTNNDYGFSILQTNDGGYIFCGSSFSNDGDLDSVIHGTLWIVKLFDSGAIEWQKSIGGLSATIGYSISQTNDSCFVIAGKSSSNSGDVNGNHGYDDFWLVKINLQGEIQWQKSLGGTLFEVANSIQQTNDGGFIVCGYSSSSDFDLTNNNGSHDFWLVKLSNTVGIPVQNNYSSMEIYQNPCNPCYIKGFRNISDDIVVFDLLGRKIFFTENILSDGIRKIEFDNYEYAFYIIKNLNTGEVKKIIKD